MNLPVLIAKTGHVHPWLDEREEVQSNVARQRQSKFLGAQGKSVELFAISRCKQIFGIFDAVIALRFTIDNHILPSNSFPNHNGEFLVCSTITTRPGLPPTPSASLCRGLTHIAICVHHYIICYVYEPNDMENC